MAAISEVTGVIAVFREIAAELAQADGVPQVLDRLCLIAVERIGGADWAGVSQGNHGSFETVAASVTPPPP